MEPAEDKIPCSTVIIENTEGFKLGLTNPETLPAIKLVWDLRYRLDTPFERLSNWEGETKQLSATHHFSFLHRRLSK